MEKMLITDKTNRRMIMKKSLSLIVSVLFAALCLGFSFSAYADDAKVLTDTNVTLSQQSFVYDGTAKNPAVIYNGITLSENTDYTVKYSNNVDAGTVKATITGINNYSGTAVKEFKITPIKFDDKKVSVSLEKSSFVYNGQSITPVVYVAYNHNYLIQNTDFTATYSNNNAPGVATVKIKGIGNYSGSISKTYIILPEKIASVSIKKSSATSAVISWSAASKVSGYEILKFDSAKNAYVHLTHVSNSQTSYKVSSLKNSTAYYYQVRAYKTVNDKNYYGEVGNTVFTFIKPSKVKLTSVTLSKTTLKVEWKKVNCSGYEITYTTDRKFKKGLKKVKIKNPKTVKKAIKKLKKNKKYYVKVRAYTDYNGVRYYGDRSTMLSSYYSNVYATYYSYYVNNKNRTTNLKIASKKINGTIIQPGETFDFNKVVGSRTAAKGYKKAHVFTGENSTTMGLAGGICQVASTVFNTALISNVKIVERHQHSQRVSYVPLGRDAAISGNVQNFRWKNNTKYAIKIKMTVKGGKITCTFYTCQKAKPKKVKLKVTQKGKTFTLKRSVKGKTNYSCKSKY
jgi:vancomycin resistance protein YoaR